MELPKAYTAKNYEHKIYQHWEKSGAFKAKINPKKKPFTISMPPPNATGTLHLGHATMLALEDIMIRMKRMQGYSALWIPGTDHASIATQNRVEKDLWKDKQLTRHDLGRSKFLNEVEKFVAKSQDTSRNQVRKMGSSCDWSRERYTLDDGLSEAVQTIFIKMYEDGLIYRGNRIVNWCPRCASTLADDEVNYREEKTQFYYFKYGPYTIATVRPETKFLDKIIVVHPMDKRYKKDIGKSIDVEWIEGKVKATVLADESVNPEFGSGAMTITPAHDFTDFEIAQRHPEIEIHKIIDEQGNLTEAAGEFAGMNARDARPKIIEKLKKKGLIEKIEENYVHNIATCYRCDTPIEPLVSQQWFVNVDKPIIKAGKKKISIKEKSIQVIKKGEIKIVPDRFNKTYFHWMENLRDWCISRQIWFGHRIPVYYCLNKDCLETVATLKAPKSCPKCRGHKFEQDPDTLDTWFSSGLWTFSTLGWPKNTPELKYFHPTSVLETGYDILFFWVARMIIMTTYALGEVPFKTVYLHGLVKDRYGQKMSKSRPETCIDPLDMIEKYGADALRLSMVVGATPGNDIRLYEEKIAGYRNFINKIWNASRFALLNIEPKDLNAKAAIAAKSLTAEDKWILSRTQTLIKEVTEKMEEYRFSEAGTQIYEFAWGVYCDWYLEFSKIQQNPEVLIEVLKTILKLLHPFTPFVTEVLWQELKTGTELITESWPKVEKKWQFTAEEADIETMKSVITAIRSVRAELKIPGQTELKATIYGHSHAAGLKRHHDKIIKLARLENLEIAEKGPKIPHAIATFIDKVEVYLPVAGIIDIEKERARITKEIDDKKAFLTSIEKKLANKGFSARAPRDIIEKEQAKADDISAKIEKLTHQLTLFK